MKNRVIIIIIAILALSGSCSAGTLYTTTTSGNVDSPGTFGGLGTPDCTGASGDRITVVAGTTLTFNIDCHLGSTTIASGHALWVKGASGNPGVAVPTTGHTLTLDGLATSTNDNLLVDQYGQFSPQSGATILMGCQSDGACRFNINGQVMSGTGTVWAAAPSQVNWSHATGALTIPGTAIAHIVQIDPILHPNVYVAQLSESFPTIYGWISNSGGTGPATASDSSLTPGKIHFSPCSGCFSASSPKTTWSQISSRGDWFIDYDKGFIFFYNTSSLTSGTLDSFMTLSFLSGDILLTGNTSYNEGIFDHSTFKYLGTTAYTHGVLTFANKQSDTVSGGTHRKVQITNNTFLYLKEPIEFSGAMTGASSDPILIQGNTSNDFFCNSGPQCGWLSTTFNGNTAYVKVDSNIVSGGAAVSSTMIGATTNYGYVSNANWTVTNNVTDGAGLLGSASVSTIFFPDLYLNGNFIYTYGNVNGGTAGVYGVAGTANHTAIISNNVIYQPYRPYQFGGYSNFTGNFITSAVHHGIITAWGTTPNSGFISDASITNNIQINGPTSISCVQLGYLAAFFLNNVTVANNTCNIRNLASETTATFVPGTFDFTDQRDASASGPILSSSNINIYNNIGVLGYTNWGRFTDSPTYQGRTRVGIAVADHNDSVAYHSDYCYGLTDQVGNTCNINRLATFTLGSGEYNISARNVTGVTLHDPTYSAPQTGGTLTWTYTKLTNVTLAWNGGTPVQVYDFSNAGALTFSHVMSAGFTASHGGRLLDSGQHWTNVGTSVSNPAGDWIMITSDSTTPAAVGQIRRITSVDSSSANGGMGCNTSAPFNCVDVQPDWTTLPDANATYVTWKSELLNLYDSGGTNYVRAAITPWSLATQDNSLLTPSTTQIDTGIGITFNMLNFDPKFQRSATDTTPTTFFNCNLRTWNYDTQGGANDDYAGFQSINATPSLTTSSFLPYMRACYTPKLATANGNCNLATSGYTVAFMGAVTPTRGTGCSAPGALAITTTSLPNGSIGTPYMQILSATNAAASPTWSVASGSLSPLFLSSAGVITGTPTTNGILSFTASVSDGVNTTTQALSITIQANSVPLRHQQPGYWY